MNETKALDVLKQAILLERRGKSFYRKIAEESNQPSVRSFFEFMAEEEQKHMDILTRQFKSYKESGRFESGIFDKQETSQVSSEVLTSKIKGKISAAEFEAAAIGAAISMEERAINIYTERADSATDPAEKELYKWLAGWERVHLKQLLEIDKDLIESVWFDNHFWSF